MIDAHSPHRTEVKVIGRTGSPACYAIRDFLYRNDVPFEWVELRDDEHARALGLDGVSDERLPVCDLPGRHAAGTADDSQPRRAARAVPRSVACRVRPGDLRRRAGRTERRRLRGLRRAEDGRRRALGGGRPGREQSEHRELPWLSGGHQPAPSSPNRARNQACRFGAEILLGREGVRGEFTPGKRIGLPRRRHEAGGARPPSAPPASSTGGWDWRTKRGCTAPASTTAPARARRSSAPAIASSSSVGGNSAAQATLHMSRYARQVTLVIRGDSLKQSVSAYLIDRIHAAKNVEVLTHTEVTALEGDRVLEAVVLTNTTDRRAAADRDALAVRVHRRRATYRVGSRRRAWNATRPAT